MCHSKLTRQDTAQLPGKNLSLCQSHQFHSLRSPSSSHRPHFHPTFNSNSTSNFCPTSTFAGRWTHRWRSTIYMSATSRRAPHRWKSSLIARKKPQKKTTNETFTHTLNLATNRPICQATRRRLPTFPLGLADLRQNSQRLGSVHVPNFQERLTQCQPPVEGSFQHPSLSCVRLPYPAQPPSVPLSSAICLIHCQVFWEIFRVRSPSL